jgi:choline dehydrogenase-like flavoprotein
LTENRTLSAVKKIYNGLCTTGSAPNSADIRQLIENPKLLSTFLMWRVGRQRIFIPEDVEYKLHACIEQEPSWQNRISLSEKRDQLGVPMVSLSWAPTEADEQTFRAVIAMIGPFWKRSGFDDICPIEWTPAAGGTSRQIIDDAEDWCHPSGTTRMGLDPAESVVGPDLICHEVPNIRVVSASVFPVSGSVNPTLTIMQLALRCADHMLKCQAKHRYFDASPVISLS